MKAAIRQSVSHRVRPSSGALVVLGRLDLHRRVHDAETLLELVLKPAEERWGAVTPRHHEMRGERDLRRAHRPDVEIMDGLDVGEGREESPDLLEVDVPRDAIHGEMQGVAEQAPGPEEHDRGHEQAGRGIDPDPPVRQSTAPATTTPAETAASATRCRNAPRTLTSPLLPLRKSSAETPLTTTPAAATHIMVVPCGSVGV